MEQVPSFSGGALEEKVEFQKHKRKGGKKGQDLRLRTGPNRRQGVDYPRQRERLGGCLQVRRQRETTSAKFCSHPCDSNRNRISVSCSCPLPQSLLHVFIPQTRLEHSVLII